MSTLETWLLPLREYPPALVLVAFIVVAAAVTWVTAKILKWTFYVMALLVFAAATGVFALWLWP